MKKKENTIILSCSFFVQMFNGLTSPFWWKGPSLLSYSASQGARTKGFALC